jgi:hypothetical protein
MAASWRLGDTTIRSVAPQRWSNWPRAEAFIPAGILGEVTESHRWLILGEQP